VRRDKMEEINLNAVADMGNTYYLNLDISSSNKIVLFGAGKLCHVFLDVLKENNIIPVAICDSSLDKIGTIISGIKVIPFEECMERFEDFYVIISSVQYFNEIKAYLLNYIDAAKIIKVDDAYISHRYVFPNNCFVKNNIKRFESLLESLADDKSKHTLVNVLKGRITYDSKYFREVYTPLQYFDKDIIELTDKECVIDGGAYIGDTLDSFICISGNKFDSIHCFEPFNENFEKLENYKRVKRDNDSRIKLYQKGLFNECKTIGFEIKQSVPAGCEINQNSEYCIDVITIDSLVANNPDIKPTFIKMDIEGSELEALQGGERTILKYRPKLAICVYHKEDDILSNFEYINSLGMEYRFYLRHYSYNYEETVLYAV